jgi:hypothetical protein
LRCAAASTLAGLVLAGCGAGGGGVDTGGNLTLEQAAAFDAFPLYFAGERVDGIPLTALLRREDTADYVSFVYGDCEPAVVGEGCAPPLEIQVWPARARSAASYDSSRPGSPELELTVVAGRCAAFVAGARLEIYEPGATVVVFSDSRERSQRVAAALRPLGAAPRGGGEAPGC